MKRERKEGTWWLTSSRMDCHSVGNDVGNRLPYCVSTSTYVCHVIEVIGREGLCVGQDDDGLAPDLWSEETCDTLDGQFIRLIWSGFIQTSYVEKDVDHPTKVVNNLLKVGKVSEGAVHGAAWGVDDFEEKVVDASCNDANLSFPVSLLAEEAMRKAGKEVAHRPKDRPKRQSQER